MRVQQVRVVWTLVAPIMMYAARRPLAEAADALADLASGQVLRQLLICRPT